MDEKVHAHAPVSRSRGPAPAAAALPEKRTAVVVLASLQRNQISRRERYVGHCVSYPKHVQHVACNGDATGPVFLQKRFAVEQWPANVAFSLNRCGSLKIAWKIGDDGCGAHGTPHRSTCSCRAPGGCSVLWVG